jgi:hypothetical protein
MFSSQKKTSGISCCWEGGHRLNILYLFRPSDLTRATPWAMKVKKYTLYGSSQNSAPFDFDIFLEKACKEAFKPYLQSQFWKKTLRVCLLNVSIDKVNLPV